MSRWSVKAAEQVKREVERLEEVKKEQEEHEQRLK